MRALLLAIGNPYRRDDGVAQSVLERLRAAPDVEWKAVLQLTPEMAEDIADFDTVIFIDSDVRAQELSIGPVDQLPSITLLTHVSTPSEILELSRALFEFGGRAFVCRIPVEDFSPGEALSPQATAFAEQAASGLENLLNQVRDTELCKRL